MMRPLWPLLLVACGLCLSPMLPAQESRKPVDPAVMRAVRANFPRPTLEPFPEHGPYEEHSCAVVFNRAPNGTPRLVAAGYGSDVLGGVAMLSYGAGAATVLDSITPHQLGFLGGACDASVVNLANPSLPDSLLAKSIEISYDAGDWFFTWDGSRLENITALDDASSPDQAPGTAMRHVQIVDVDHFGPMQIVGDNDDADKGPQSDGIDASGTETLFRFDGSTYKPARKLQGFWVLDGGQRGASSPSTLTDAIAMHHAPAPSYKLTVVNGTRRGGGRTTGLSIVLNGTQIIAPADVNQTTGILSRTISLRKVNTVRFISWGPPDSVVYVMIEAK